MRLETLAAEFGLPVSRALADHVDVGMLMILRHANHELPAIAGLLGREAEATELSQRGHTRADRPPFL